MNNLTELSSTLWHIAVLLLNLKKNKSQLKALTRSQRFKQSKRASTNRNIKNKTFCPINIFTTTLARKPKTHQVDGTSYLPLLHLQLILSLNWSYLLFWSNKTQRNLALSENGEISTTTFSSRSFKEKVGFSKVLFQNLGAAFNGNNITPTPHTCPIQIQNRQQKSYSTAWPRITPYKNIKMAI